jgi:membrane protease subunit (stomatin/prohibitin family)
LESGNKDDFANFWNAILLLKDQDWFLYNVKTWLWFNSDDSSNPEDFEIEDIKEHYIAKTKKTA